MREKQLWRILPGEPPYGNSPWRLHKEISAKLTGTLFGIVDTMIFSRRWINSGYFENFRREQFRAHLPAIRENYDTISST